MQWIFTQTDEVVDALEKGANEPLPRAYALITNAPPLLPSERIDIYSNAYFFRLAEALGSVYPTVQQFVEMDEEPYAFTKLVAQYVGKHPSVSYKIEDCGASFAVFLENNEISFRFPFLPDLARVEWAVAEAVFRSRRPPLQSKEMAAVAPEDWAHARLECDSTVSLLSLNWAVVPLWENREQPIPHAPRETCRQNILVFRAPNRRIQVRILSEEAFQILSGLDRGETLGHCLGALSHSDVPIQEWFAEWVADGVLSRLSFAL